MPIKFLGQYLLEQGVVAREELLDGIQHQQSVKLPLTVLALKNQLLSEKQLAALDLEAEDSGIGLLELAIRKGLLKFSQLEELARQPARKWMCLAEALLRRRHVSLRDMGSLLDQYAREFDQEDALEQMSLSSLPERNVVSAFVNATVDILLHYTRQIVKISSVSRIRPVLRPEHQTFGQRVIGDRTFHYLLELSPALVRSLATHVMQAPQTTIDATVLDSVTEFVNVVVGNACTRMNMEGYRLSAEPPQVLDMKLAEAEISESPVTVSMNTLQGDFQVVLSFRRA
jgi:hypothetical protein